MSSRPNLLLLLSVLTVLGLLALTAVQTVDALGHVEQAEQDKAETIERAIVASIRAVAQYGREKEARIAAVLEEVARDPEVISITLREQGGTVLLAAGQPLVEATSGALVERTLAFEIDWQCRGGPGHGGMCGDMPPGRYELILRLDPSAAAQVRSVILLEAGAVSLLLILAAVFASLLVRSIRDRERLTRTVALEQQRNESLESLRLLAAGLAHEIRNPLGAIRGYAQLAHEQCGDSVEARERTALMLRELDRVAERLQEFLSFARRRAIEPRPVDLNELAEETVALVGADAEAEGVELSVQGKGGAAVVDGDPAQLKELLLNLVLNAIEACSEGDSVVVTTSEARQGVELSVRDSGKGIDAADLERVFEPYFTTRREGSGLGLAISKRIAEGHGAQLTIDSAVGVGTTVTLLISSAG
jgi:signal transduction histidine kinase